MLHKNNNLLLALRLSYRSTIYWWVEEALCHEPHHHNSSHGTPGQAGGYDHTGIGFVHCLGSIDGAVALWVLAQHRIGARTIIITIAIDPMAFCLPALLRCVDVSTVAALDTFVPIPAILPVAILAIARSVFLVRIKQCRRGMFILGVRVWTVEEITCQIF